MLRFSEFGTMKPLTILQSSANSTTKCSERIITSPTKHLPQPHHFSPMNNSRMMHTQEFMNACYNLIDLKIIDLDEYQGFLDNFTTTEELDAYLTAREDMSF